MRNKEFQLDTVGNVVRWVVNVQLFLIMLGSIYMGLKGGIYLFSYLVGCMLVLLNFLVLARILPSLIRGKEVRASVVSLLLSFYSRLIFTGLVLLIGIVFLKFPVFPLVLGLSTIVVGIISWIVKYMYTNNHKEASGYVSSSTTRIAS